MERSPRTARRNDTRRGTGTHAGVVVGGACGLLIVAACELARRISQLGDAPRLVTAGVILVIFAALAASLRGGDDA